MYKGTLEAITNRQTWSDTFTCVTLVNGENVAVNVATAIFELYVQDPGTKISTLTAKSPDSHFTLPGGGTDGVVKWTFTDTETRKLCAALTYDVALYITVAGVVTPLALLKLPVLEGIRP